MQKIKEKLIMVGPSLRFSPDTSFEIEGEIKIKYWNKKHGEKTIILKPECVHTYQNGNADEFVKSKKIINVD